MLFDNEAQLVANGLTSQQRQKRADVLGILRAAIDVVDPYRLCEFLITDRKLVVDEETIDLSSFHRIFLVAFGKASLGMSRAICDRLEIARGVVISPSPGPSPADSVEIYVGGHPLPTTESLRGTEKVIDLFQACHPGDCIIVCISGGGSSLLAKPRVPLSDLQKITDRLMAAGATIEELNIVRKHLCEVKGGQLLSYTKATVVSLIISDVIGDPVHSIASGPTAPDPSSFEDAVEVLKKYRLWKDAPTSVRTCISQGVAGEIPETPKPGDPCFSRVKNLIVANNLLACQAAAAAAMERGYSAVVVSTTLSGEAREVGRLLVENAKANKEACIALIAGGETTVTVTRSGKGGRNQEVVLGAVQELSGTDLVFGSCASDGVDGHSPAAGAIADGDTLARAMEKNLDPQKSLARNDAYAFFSRLGDALHSGPTGTNIMDIQVLIS